LDGEGTGIVNASLQFDPDRMEPTYHLVKGRPGRSYGLAIARRLGFPAAVLDKAEGFLEGGEVRVEDLLERLERKERDAERQARELEIERSETARLRAEVTERERTLRVAERSAEERAREEARRVLMEARAEVEQAIDEVRSAATADADLEEASHRARRRVEEAARRSRPKRGTRTRATRSSAPPLSVGDRVRVHATGAKGAVLEVREGRALVEMGALRLELPLDDLEPLGGGDATPPDGRKSAGGWTGPTGGQVRTEVDLRGLRVDEVDTELVRALDQAVLEDLSELRIIHGKGTGALRQRVTELLAGDARIVAYRMGGPTEGGAGVTVATLR
jgi:DNA mismatch repair protein MutS2